MIATPLQDAALDIERLTEGVRREMDRRYEFCRMLHATDRVLFRLEDLNEAGVIGLPAGVGDRVRHELRELPAACLEVVVGGKVQELLDGVFVAQERLFRWRDPQWDSDEEPGVAAEPVPFTAADLERWGGICRWLDSFGPVGLSKSDAPEKWAGDLVAMQGHGLVYLRDKWRWRTYTTWPARLEKLRTQLEVG